MFCRHCGANLDDHAVVCPHCGFATHEVPPATTTDTTNTLAIVGFVLVFFNSIAGLICSILGYNKAVHEGADHKNLALAGIIIGIVSIVLSIFVVILYAVFWVDILAAL